MSERIRHRLSVAVEVGEPARAALERAVAPCRRRYPGLRWTASDQWHITLVRTGGIAGERVVAVQDAAATVAGHRPQHRLRLQGRVSPLGRVLYAEVERDEGLEGLAEDLRQWLDRVGVPIDDAGFVRHCAVARLPSGCPLPPDLVTSMRGPAVSWTVRRIVVLRSRLQVGGPGLELCSAHDFGSSVPA